jgi:uncharacterized protein YdhG (YjbR/CyaY superfamily)
MNGAGMVVDAILPPGKPRARHPGDTSMDETVQTYLDAIPPEQKPLFERLQSLILQLYPDAEIVISYQIPTYKAKAGRVSLGLWKNGVSLYTTDPQYIKGFTSQHPTIKAGKASLNFKLTDELPEKDLREVIKQAIEHRSPS